MSFQSPLFLIGLGIVPLALAAYHLFRRRARRYSVRFTGVPTLASILPELPRWRRHAPTALYVMALAALAIALARPQATVAVPQDRASVVLIMDASRSMSATDVDPSRLDAAQDAGGEFLDRVPDELRVGAVAYSTAPHTLKPPTVEHDEIRDVLDSLVADGGTATGDAMVAALGMLDDDDRGRGRPPAAIVLLSDGKATSGPDPAGVARRAGRLDIPIYTVALGTPEGVVPGGPLGSGLPVPPDPESLRDIARESGGRAFTAEDAGQLDTVYERLGSQIGTREEKREVTAGFAAAGIVLLLAAAGVSLRWFGRLP
jgi:Ca-activated chloride channel homolog